MNPTPCDCSPAFVDGRIEAALGTRWVALGRDLRGFDCWGFVRYALGLLDAPEAPFFDRESRPGQIQELAKSFRQVPSKTAHSIILLGTQGRFAHVGVYHPTGTVYHCIEHGGVCGHRFDRLGLLGFDSFEFYKWGLHD